MNDEGDISVELEVDVEEKNEEKVLELQLPEMKQPENVASVARLNVVKNRGKAAKN